jgi:hypothetical protein
MHETDFINLDAILRLIIVSSVSSFATAQIWNGGVIASKLRDVKGKA